MTTIFSTTKGSLQLLQSSLSDGKANSFPKLLLISPSAILSYKCCSSPVVLNFFTAWKGMEAQGQESLCILRENKKSKTEVMTVKLQLFKIFSFPERKMDNSHSYRLERHDQVLQNCSAKLRISLNLTLTVYKIDATTQCFLSAKKIT